MPVIAISSDDPESGKMIAGQVAQRLGYELVDRDYLPDIARQYSVALDDLILALDQPPGLLAMRSRRRRELLNIVQAACLEKVAADNVVCHGLAAHLYLQGVSHALRIRIVNQPAGDGAQAGRDRCREEQEQARWSQEFYGCDQTDASQYDLVLSLATLEPDKAVEIICDAAGYRKFQAMTYSRQCLNDKILASRVRLKLLPLFPTIRVESSHGTVVASLSGRAPGMGKKKTEVRRMAGEVPGVNYVEVHVSNGFWAKDAQDRS